MSDAGGSRAGPSTSPRRRSWWARLGFVGFLFFLIKGLLWLLIPAALWIAS